MLVEHPPSLNPGYATESSYSTLKHDLLTTPWVFAKLKLLQLLAIYLVTSQQYVIVPEKRDLNEVNMKINKIYSFSFSSQCALQNEF